MTTRGFKEPEFIKVVELIDLALKFAIELQSSLQKPDNKLKDFKATINDGLEYPILQQIKAEVAELVAKFPLPADI